jgi:hypothetical protein
VNQALDQASMYLYGEPFGVTRLYTGFDAVWGSMESEFNENCTMAVFGNGDIHLYNQEPDPPPSLPPEAPTVTIVASYWSQDYEMEMFLSVPFNIGGTIFYSGWDIIPIY